MKRTNSSNVESPQKKLRTPDSFLNSKYLNEEHAKTLKEDYKKTKPYPHRLLTQFANEEFAEQVRKALLEQEFIEKRNDLYSFEQTDDLKVTKNKALSDFREALYSDKFRKFLKELTGIELNVTVDMSGHKYSQGSQLLCHDDELDDRRIAFIWYLVPKDWSKSDGGTLDLFDVDKNNQPSTISKQIVPQWNSLLFFEISPITYHQVAEVVANKERLSISGWFHGDPIEPAPPYSEEPVPKIEVFPDGPPLSDWINPIYLGKDVQEDLKNHFSTNGSISLAEFLVKDKYNALVEAFKSKNTPWAPIGPASRRHYDSLGRWTETETGIILEAKIFLRSKAFLSLIHSITSLLPEKVCKGEYRRFKHQDYTLVHDNEQVHESEGLDYYLSFIDGDIGEENGGFITYLDSDDEIVSLPPAPNTFCLVYREAGFMQFVKFLASTSPHIFYSYQNTIIPSPEDIEEEDENEKDNEGDSEGDDPYSKNTRGEGGTGRDDDFT